MSEEKNYEEIKCSDCDIGVDSDYDCERDSDVAVDDDYTQNVKKIRQREIDDLTLKLLTNHGKFNKYMSLNDDDDDSDFEKMRELNTKKNFFRERIIDYTIGLMDNINSASNSEIRDNFNSYIYSVIKHLEYDTSLEGEDVVREKYDYTAHFSKKWNYRHK